MAATGLLGLTSADAAERLRRDGPNRVGGGGTHWRQLLLRQFRSPLLLLLLAAAGVSLAVGDRLEPVIIVTMVVCSVGLGFYNEFRAAKAADAMRARIARKCLAWRDGSPRQVSIEELVVGDAVDLRLGDIVPADARVLVAVNLECDESVLTGESLPVQKSVGSQLYMGSVVSAGSARVEVAATGVRATYGAIAAGLSEVEEPTAFQRGLTGFSLLLVKVAGSLTIGIFAINVLLSKPLLEAVLFSLAIAVGISPELLPAVLATGLARGAHRLAERRVLVKRLVAIEDLGDIEVLFTDKTGTLTEGEVVLDGVVCVDGVERDELLRLALSCSDVEELAGGGVSGNALDIALRNAAGTAPPWPRRGELPFDHLRRLQSVLVDREGEQWLVAKGAADSVAARARQLDAVLSAEVAEAERQGSRVLLVARRPWRGGELTAAAESDLEVLGALVFNDPPKATARAALERLTSLGIELKIVTGDSLPVAERVCDVLGIAAGRGVLGSELDSMSDEQLQQLLPQARIFARVTPEQKARIVRCQRAAGRDVAFLGDGVNDALALHAADVGVSVDDATDVAREAADVVLLVKDLDVLADGVIEGRRIFANTVKYILMGTSSNFGNMFSAAAASAFLPFLPMLPAQILLNNVLYDSSQLALPADRVDPEAVARPTQWDIGLIRRFMLWFGPVSSLFDFATFALLFQVFRLDEAGFQSGWFVESLATQTLVVFAIRTRRRPAWRSRPALGLTLTVLVVVAIGAWLPVSPLAGWFGFEPLAPQVYAALAGLTALYLVIADRVKLAAFRSASR